MVIVIILANNCITDDIIIKMRVISINFSNNRVEEYFVFIVFKGHSLTDYIILMKVKIKINLCGIIKFVIIGDLCGNEISYYRGDLDLFLPFFPLVLGPAYSGEDKGRFVRDLDL